MTAFLPTDLVRTHDEARALLTYAVLGARVEFHRVRDDSPHAARARSYQIVLRDAFGREAVCLTDTYVLPLPAARLAQSARDAVEATFHARKM